MAKGAGHSVCGRSMGPYIAFFLMQPSDLGNCVYIRTRKAFIKNDKATQARPCRQASSCDWVFSFAGQRYDCVQRGP